MNSNELNQATEIMIAMIVISTVMFITMVTVGIGNSIKDSATDKASDIVGVIDTTHTNLEAVLIHEPEVPLESVYQIIDVPLASVFKIIEDNKGSIISIKGTFLDSDLQPTIVIPNMSHNDFVTRFDKKVTVGGVKYSNDTYALELYEVY